MRTKAFEPNEQQIEQRKKIVPYGRAAKYYLQEPTPISFVLYTTEQESAKEEKSTGVYTPAAVYRPSTDYKIQGEVPVKITNIPLKTTQTELYEILVNKCNEWGYEKITERPFTRLTLVFDRETRQSRGYAYANCQDIEKARELAKIIRCITIEEFVLCAEVLTK